MRIPDLTKTQNKLQLAINSAIERDYSCQEYDKEADLVKVVKKYVESLPVSHIKRHNVGAVTGSYTNKQGRTKKQFIKFGEPGEADFTGCYKGRFVAIECKVGNNKQQPSQEEYQLKIEAAGGIYILAYSLGDVIRGLQYV